MKTNKNPQNSFKETIQPTSQQLKDLTLSLSNADVTQKLKQTQASFANPGKVQSLPTTSVNKANNIGGENTSLSGTVGTRGTNTGKFKNLVETWEKEKAAQERINRQQAPSVNAIGSTNNLTNNNSGVMPQELSALNQALEAYHRNTLAKGPSTDSGTKSTVFNTASYADPSATTSKSSGASTTKQADGLYYDASDGSYTRMVNGKSYKITYKDSRYGAIRNEYNKTHTSDIMYDMDSKGVITKYVNGTPNMVRPDEARYARVATEFLAANIGDKTDQGIRDLAKKYPALQVNWWDNGGDDTITIGLQNTREPLITLTDEYEDGTYTSTNGIITCQLQKGGNYVIAAQPTATTTNQTNTSQNHYTNRPTTTSRDGSIDKVRVAAVNGTGTAGATDSTWAVPGTTSLEMDNVGNLTRTMTNGNSYPVSVGNTDQYKRVLKEYLSNKPGEGLRDLLQGTRIRVNWDNKNKVVTISYTTTTTRQEVTLARLTDSDSDGTYTTSDGVLSCKLQNGKMVITAKTVGSSINNGLSADANSEWEKTVAGRTYKMDNQGTITKAFSDGTTKTYTKEDTNNYPEELSEYLYANVGSQMGQTLRVSLANTPLQISWDGNNDCLVIRLKSTKEALAILTDEDEDGAFQTGDGSVFCVLDKSGKNFIIAGERYKFKDTIDGGLYDGWYVSQGFNDRTTDRKGHFGYDMYPVDANGKKIEDKVAVKAVADGTIYYAGLGDDNGYHIVIESTINGKTYYQFYAHLQEEAVDALNKRLIAGETIAVKAGDTIGLMGGTGTYGEIKYDVHLHFGIFTYKEGETVPETTNPFGYTDGRQHTPIPINQPQYYGSRKSYTFYDPILFLSTNGCILN